MKSPVHFIASQRSDGLPETEAKLKRLLQASRVLDCAAAKDAVAVKLHFGEQGNTGFVPPPLLRVVAEALKARGAKPFLSDTNTLYKGRRTNSADHLSLAREHGFTPQALGAEVVIPDDTRPENVASVALGGRYIKTARVARVYASADVLVGVAHFKGHIMCGFGGALKNVGMGCATREGKLSQHSDVSPMVMEKSCTGCGACVNVCSAQAISLNEGRSVIDAALCVGCASCLAACPEGALQVRWEAGGGVIQEKMAEYAQAALTGKKGKAAFLNVCLKITAECDCIAKDEPALMPDLGLLASADPVALDQACYDLAVKAAGRDVFKAAHPRRDGFKQLRHAEEIGLGSREYELVHVD
ncbi:MAG: DUF362 domain-containing protein [Elusimicrobia bacterium]|nr:DUF362 domain-containing protein [Elusimicrobiota bacterium]